MNILILLLSITASVYASEKCDGIVPRNNLWIGENHRESNITRDQFDEILDKASKVYSPLFEDIGRKLVVRRYWADGTVNAFASQTGKFSYIHMYGGFARHKDTTLDGFLLVTCHEFGHHLGGAPKSGEGNWVTNEGQSDYFAAAKCFKLLVENDDNEKIVSNMKIPKIVKDKCSSVYSSVNDIAICERSSMAGLSLARVFSSLNFGRNVRFERPSRRKVWWTSHAHPAAQCRLDTYFQASLCNKDYKSNFDDQDANINACTRSEGYHIGMRPRCWYKP